MCTMCLASQTNVPKNVMTNEDEDVVEEIEDDEEPEGERRTNNERRTSMMTITAATFLTRIASKGTSSSRSLTWLHLIVLLLLLLKLSAPLGILPPQPSQPIPISLPPTL